MAVAPGIFMVGAVIVATGRGPRGGFNGGEHTNTEGEKLMTLVQSKFAHSAAVCNQNEITAHPPSTHSHGVVVVVDVL